MCFTTEVGDELLQITRGQHRFAQVQQRLAAFFQFFDALGDPVFQDHVAVLAVVGIYYQFIRAVNGNRFLHLAEQFLEIDDIAAVLGIAIQPIGAANCLKQIVVAQVAVQVDVGAAGRIEAGQQLADHNQQPAVGRLVLEAALHLGFVLVGAVEPLEHPVFVGLVLVAVIAAGRLFGVLVFVRLERGDDAHMLAKISVLEQPEIVASVIDFIGHQNGGTPTTT